MIKGFSLIEVFVTLSLSLVILSIVLYSVAESTKYSKKITGNQQVMESIFHTIDSLRSDLTKCGMRLQEASKHFDISLFENSGSSFKLVYGLQSEALKAEAYKGETTVSIDRNDYFKKRKTVLIYNIENKTFEFNEIEEIDGDTLVLALALQNDYPEKSCIVVLKRVEYKLYDKENVLKRKLDRGYFQPIVENVSDFSVTFFPDANSVLYRVEVNEREQIRGYIFLTNMVQK
ncbi:MAG: type II secretion system protein [Candidatus Aminicenantes bacterium]|nr:type II secretion system protein [Candidatus Aminicenantes bacterium]